MDAALHGSRLRGHKLLAAKLAEWKKTPVEGHSHGMLRLITPKLTSSLAHPYRIL